MNWDEPMKRAKDFDFCNGYDDTRVERFVQRLLSIEFNIEFAHLP